MACLGVSLYTIVLARSENVEEKVIFGGYENVYAGTDLVSYADPNAESEEIDDGLIWPDVDITLRQYSMVNADNLLASAFEPDLAIDENGKLVPIYGTKYQYFDAAAKPYLDKMLQDMEALGFTPYIASSYRTYSYQSQLYNTKAFGIFMEMGYTNADYDKYGTEEGTEVYNAYQLAAEKAKKYTAAPGASEHQLGLAVDIWDRERDRLGSYSYMDEEFRTWLEEHSWEYGFIQRYPSKKCLRTGWDEPWHYRYVGVEVAKFIKENDICYEEFYKHYSPDFKD
jgi:LAS superfamily LD-carboxypeptidase LdcB